MGRKRTVGSTKIKKQKSRKQAIKEKVANKEVNDDVKEKVEEQVSKEKIVVTKLEDITDELLLSYKNEDDAFIIPELEAKASIAFEEFQGEKCDEGIEHFGQAEKKMLFEYLIAQTDKQESKQDV